MEHVDKRRNSIFGHIAILSQLTRPYTVKLSYHLADYPTRRGNVLQVALTNDSWTRSATTTTVHPLTCGEMLSGEVTLGRRNGPRRLSNDDDGGSVV